MSVRNLSGITNNQVQNISIVEDVENVENQEELIEQADNSWSSYFSLRNIAIGISVIAGGILAVVAAKKPNILLNGMISLAGAAGVSARIVRTGAGTGNAQAFGKLLVAAAQTAPKAMPLICSGAVAVANRAIDRNMDKRIDGTIDTITGVVGAKCQQAFLIPPALEPILHPHLHVVLPDDDDERRVKEKEIKLLKKEKEKAEKKGDKKKVEKLEKAIDKRLPKFPDNLRNMA